MTEALAADISGTSVEHLLCSSDYTSHDFVDFQSLNVSYKDRNSALTLKQNKPPPLAHTRCLKVAYCRCLRSGRGTVKNV
jgi:hypothetical protein